MGFVNFVHAQEDIAKGTVMGAMSYLSVARLHEAPA